VSSSNGTPAVRLRMPAMPDAVGVARQALTGACEALGLGPRATGDVRLAVSEACTNVVAHAYRDQSEPGELEVSVLLVPGELTVIVRDRGSGIAPRLEGGGLGLGLPLIAALTRRAEIVEPPGGGTEVAMTFVTSETEEPSA
jgi:anti-sigma regulatory factor (Ser/Thr protein kinase)